MTQRNGETLLIFIRLDVARRDTKCELTRKVEYRVSERDENVYVAFEDSAERVLRRRIAEWTMEAQRTSRKHCAAAVNYQETDTEQALLYGRSIVRR